MSICVIIRIAGLQGVYHNAGFDRTKMVCRLMNGKNKECVMIVYLTSHIGGSLKKWNKNTHAVKHREWFVRQLTVYAQPELEGESIDKEYERFLSGLGITNLMILPHYQDIKDDILDGQRLFEDITYSDSYGREFYALEDGSYFLIENKSITLFGAAHLIKDGNIKQICEKDKSVCII